MVCRPTRRCDRTLWYVTLYGYPFVFLRPKSKWLSTPFFSVRLDLQNQYPDHVKSFPYLRPSSTSTTFNNTVALSFVFVRKKETNVPRGTRIPNFKPKRLYSCLIFNLKQLEHHDLCFANTYMLE